MGKTGKRQDMTPNGRVRFHLFNLLLVAGAVLLAMQALTARTVSAGWDLGLLLPLLIAAALAGVLLVRLIRGKRMISGKKARVVTLSLLGTGGVVFAVVLGLLVAEPVLHGPQRLEQADGARFIIVLGAGIKADGTPTWALANRLDAAHAYYVAHPGHRLIVSGGQGRFEPISEALSMARYLLDKGVPEGDILLEDRSTSTMENFQYSLPILREAGWGGEPVLYATNDFHLFRARMLAGRNGLDAYGIGAATPPIIRMNVYLREFFALFKSLAVDWPA